MTLKMCDTGEMSWALHFSTGALRDEATFFLNISEGGEASVCWVQCTDFCEETADPYELSVCR